MSLVIFRRQVSKLISGRLGSARFHVLASGCRLRPGTKETRFGLTCWRTASLIALPVLAACAIFGCGSAPGAPTSAEASAITSGLRPASSLVDSEVDPVPGPPPPASPSDYGIWANGVPARSIPVRVSPGTSVEFTVDRFDAGSTVSIDGAGIHTTTTVDEHGRVEFAVDTSYLLPGVHAVHFSGNNGAAVGFTGRIRITGQPVVGSDYATVLCCFNQPSDGSSIEDVAVRLIVNGTDLTEFFGPHVDDDGSVLISLPVPNVGQLTINVVDEATGQKLEEYAPIQGP